MRRKIYQELLQWKQRSGESALLVQGARRGGQSYIVEAFAKAEYKSFILIDFNTFIPFLFAYGLHKADDVLCDRATRFLESLKAENNHVTRLWDGAGLPVSTAADSTALLKLLKL